MTKDKIFPLVKKIGRGIFLGIFALVAVVAIWLTVSKLILKSPVPSVLGFATLTVETGSMSGTIEIGDMIIIHKQNDYKIGDIVTYLHEGDRIPTTHRIINYNEDGSFVTRGDSNNGKDSEPVTNDIIYGKVITVIPGGGIFATWVQTEGWIYILACLGILGLGFFVLSGSSDNTAPVAEAETAEPKKEGEENDPAQGTPEPESDNDDK